MIVNQTCLTCQAPLHYDLGWQDIFSMRSIKVSEICPACKAQLQTLNKGDYHCHACNRPLDSSSSDIFHQIYHKDKEIYCLDCYRWLDQHPIALVSHQSLISYNTFVKEWLYRYKYQGDSRLASLTSELLQKAYKNNKEASWLVLPSSPKSLQARGFHPTSLLLEKAGIPYSLPFKYIGDGIRQAEKNRQDRLKLGQAFEILPNSLAKSSHYLIFDDLYTTGATLMAAKRCLQKYLLDTVGQDSYRISSLSLARDY